MAGVDDPYLWLEDITGDDALDWVRRHNEPTLAELRGERFEQMRTEALETLRQGIQAQYEQDNAEAPEGRQAKRRANYADAIGKRQDFGDRISTVGGLDDSNVLERLMAAAV